MQRLTSKVSVGSTFLVKSTCSSCPTGAGLSHSIISGQVGVGMSNSRRQRRAPGSLRHYFLIESLYFDIWSFCNIWSFLGSRSTLTEMAGNQGGRIKPSCCSSNFYQQQMATAVAQRQLVQQHYFQMMHQVVSAHVLQQQQQQPRATIAIFSHFGAFC